MELWRPGITRLLVNQVGNKFKFHMVLICWYHNVQAMSIGPLKTIHHPLRLTILLQNQLAVQNTLERHVTLNQIQLLLFFDHKYLLVGSCSCKMK